MLARAEAGWGRATYGLSLGRLRKSYETRANDPDLVGRRARGRAARRRTLTRDDRSAWITAAHRVDSRSRRRWQGAAAGSRRRRARVPRTLDARAAASSITAPPRRSSTTSSELRALGSFACSLPRRCASSASASQSLQVAPERPRPGHLYVCTLAAGRLLRPSASLRRRARRRPRVSGRDRRSGAARRRARRDLAGAAAVERQDRRSGLRFCVAWRRGVTPRRGRTDRSREPRAACTLQLFVPRHARVPRDLCLVADAAGVSAAAGRSRRFRISR